MWRGERRRSSFSPSSLRSSASHCLFTAFLVHFAGGGKGTGKEPGSEGSGSEGSGSGGSDSEGSGCEGSGRGDGDFASGGGGAAGAAEKGANIASALTSLVTVVMQQWHLQ
jgi:hypothetical protein